jgi:hypothetical protein
MFFCDCRPEGRERARKDLISDDMFHRKCNKKKIDTPSGSILEVV